jgi:hypothetical protein
MIFPESNAAISVHTYSLDKRRTGQLGARECPPVVGITVRDPLDPVPTLSALPNYFYMLKIYCTETECDMA